MDINKLKPIYKTDFLSLFHADCMEVMATFPDKYFNLAIIDPPYGIERFKKCKQNDDLNTKDVFANKFLNNEAFNNNKPTKEYWNELFRVSKNQIVFGANNFEMPPSEYFLIWDKKQPMPNFARCEYAWVSMGLKTPAKICEYPITKHNQVDKIHPTQKPTYLYDFILKNYSAPNQKLLDTHFGSGSIALAVDRANRLDNMNLHLTACEIDKDYVNASIKRISENIKQGTFSF